MKNREIFTGCAFSILLVFTACGEQGTSQQDNSRQYKALLDRLGEAHKNRDIDAVMSLFAEDSVFINTDGRRLEDHDEIRALYSMVWNAVTDFRLNNWRYLVDGDHAAVQWNLSGTSASGDGERLTVEPCYLITFRDGKIAVMHLYVKPKHE